MEKVSSHSCFVRIKNHLSSDNKVLLIDEDGSYRQKEAFAIYCGIMNQITKYVKRGTTCLLAPFSKKETILIIAAIISLGGIVMVGDPTETRESFIDIIKDKITIDVFVTFIDNKPYFEIDNNLIEIKLKQEELRAKPYLLANKKKPAFYVLTSGSSGANKIVAISDYSLLNNIARQETNDSNYEGVGYLCLPLNHIFGLGTQLQYFIAGHPAYISKTRNADKALEVIEKYRCTTIPNVPTFFYMLINAQHNAPHDISSLRYGVVGGGAYSKEQFCYMEDELGMILSSSYGMTESATGISYSAMECPRDERCEGVGKPIKGVDVVLKDDSLSICEEGEVCFKGYNLMLGYVSKDKIELPLDKDGYFHTGDIGFFDRKGNLHIIGRKKNIIIRGGVNISSDLLEQKIMKIDGVKDVCVVGLTDSKYGEVPAAYVVSDKYKNTDLFKNILKNTLKKGELPTTIILDKEMPLLANSKHNVRLIKELLIQENKKAL